MQSQFIRKIEQFEREDFLGEISPSLRLYVHSFLIDKALKKNPLRYLQGLSDAGASYKDFLQAFSQFG